MGSHVEPLIAQIGKLRPREPEAEPGSRASPGGVRTPAQVQPPGLGPWGLQCLSVNAETGVGELLQVSLVENR